MVTPEILTFPERRLRGLVFFGDPFRSHAAWTEENEIGRLWQRYSTLLHDCETRRGRPTPDVFYELHILNPESHRTGEYEVFVGHEVRIPEREESAPDQLLFSEKTLPAGRYVRLTIRGRQMTEDWTRDIVLPEGERLYPDLSINCYDSRFLGMDRLDESCLDVYALLY